jgi:unsaturated chondroitin disaccharide hydrolase
MWFFGRYPRTRSVASDLRRASLRSQQFVKPRAAVNEMMWNEAIQRIRMRVEDTARSASKGLPHFADPATKQWTWSPDGDWTGGYFCAMLWLGAATGPAADRDRWLGWARKFSERLRPRLASESSSRALLFYYGAALGSILWGDREARGLALEAAAALAKMYNPRAGVLPLGGAFEEVSNVGATEAEIDMVQAVALLMWACRESGDRSLKEIAASHARRHIDFCLRPDGSICQSATFDPQSGAMTRRYTHKGISDNSTWARAQAWGMLGWALSAQWCEDASFLEPAGRAADWWIANVPADHVAFWDFDDPAIPNTHRDTSATAIAAASLLKLAALSRDEGRRQAWRAAAEATAHALIERHLGEEGGLWDGCFNQRIGLATKHELVWGTYYLFEALHVLDGRLDPMRI